MCCTTTSARPLTGFTASTPAITPQRPTTSTSASISTRGASTWRAWAAWATSSSRAPFQVNGGTSKVAVASSAGTPPATVGCLTFFQTRRLKSWRSCRPRTATRGFSTETMALRCSTPTAPKCWAGPPARRLTCPTARAATPLVAAWSNGAGTSCLPPKMASVLTTQPRARGPRIGRPRARLKSTNFGPMETSSSSAPPAVRVGTLTAW